MVIRVFVTTISANNMMRKHQQDIIDALQARHVPFEVVDVSAPENEEAKTFMRQKAKPVRGQTTVLPPQVFNDDEYLGDYEAFAEAREDDHVEIFFKLAVPTDRSAVNLALDSSASADANKEQLNDVKKEQSEDETKNEPDKHASNADASKSVDGDPSKLDTSEDVLKNASENSDAEKPTDKKTEVKVPESDTTRERNADQGTPDVDKATLSNNGKEQDGEDSTSTGDVSTEKSVTVSDTNTSDAISNANKPSEDSIDTAEQAADTDKEKPVDKVLSQDNDDKENPGETTNQSEDKDKIITDKEKTADENDKEKEGETKKQSEETDKVDPSDSAVVKTDQEKSQKQSDEETTSKETEKSDDVKVTAKEDDDKPREKAWWED